MTVKAGGLAALALAIIAMAAFRGEAGSRAFGSERRHAEDPPPAHTGGFGEPTCGECHVDGEPTGPGGTLSFVSLPPVYQPGDRFVIGVALSRPAMVAAGFQLAARFVDGPRAGRQAGRFRAVDDRVEVSRDGAVDYAHHSRPGTALTAEFAARWVVEWTAPDEAVGSVIFHLAATAANGDDSELGDTVHATSAVAAPYRSGGGTVWQGGRRWPGTVPGPALRLDR